ncbi:FecR domain-containing protein [Verrucomicrobium spinosum]|uniref:FecR domain-containing protein n=1 Tax=Verrucomicrobium spinosum TaxID=2736 RepID=UPI000174614D|nr:FecR domain-containing protein [Verrucomicrobium spinosum]
MSENTPYERFKLSRSIDLLIEGLLDDASAKDLQARLKTDDDLLAQYLEKVRIDTLLLELDWDGMGSAEPAPQKAISRRPLLGLLGVVTVLMLALTATVAWLMKTESGQTLPPTASRLPLVEFTPAAVFEMVAGGAGDDGQLRFGEEMVMQQGGVNIRLGSGVEAQIQGPSRFAVTGANQIKLERGSGRFVVPHHAKGFTVETPWMEVVDLGTIFTVSAEEEVHEVHVEEGRVEVRMKNDSALPQTLGEGESMLSLATGRTLISNSDASFKLRDAAPDMEVIFDENLAGIPAAVFAEQQPAKGAWSVLEGTPVVREGRFDAQGRDASMMGHFSRAVEPGSDAVVLLSFESVSPRSLFHSKGFAGVSLFDGEGEVLFFGDKGSDSYSWEVLTYGKGYRGPNERRTAYDLAIQGSEATFTIRYRQRTGAFEVFRGWGVRGVPIAKGLTDPDLRFDRVRVKNGKGGDFSFTKLRVSVITENHQ